MYTCMYCIPSKLESRDCSSYSPWSNYWHDLELPLSSDFCSGINHGPTPRTPAPWRLLHGSLPWHLLRRWHTPGKDHPQRAHAEAPPVKTKALRCNTWQSLKYIEKLRLHGVNMAPPTWHQPGSNVVLMYKYVAVDRKLGTQYLQNFSSLVRYIATIDQHGFKSQGLLGVHFYSYAHILELRVNGITLTPRGLDSQSLKIWSQKIFHLLPVNLPAGPLWPLTVWHKM